MKLKYSRLKKIIDNADKSDVRKAHVVAILVKNGQIFVEVNIKKSRFDNTSPFKWTHHAEWRVIKRAKEKANNAELYVVRLMKKGGFGNAYPCKTCWKLIRVSKIKHVFHT